MEKRAVLLLIVLTLFTMGLTIQKTEFETSPAIVEKVVVPGDTLWDLAVLYHKEGTDIRSYVAMIAEMNQLENQPLQPGDTLRIPLLP